jgi:hypothetical protein
MCRTRLWNRFSSSVVVFGRQSRGGHITSGFRDDYRQELANGNKAAPDSSYHGGSRRGGYGHGLAADLVSVKGDTRAERCMP